MPAPADMDATDWSSLLSQHNRLLHVQTALPDALVVEHWEGVEAINEEPVFTLDCISPSASLNLAALAGTSMYLQLAQMDGQQRSWQGIVFSTEERGSDGGIARYRLHMGTWLSLLKRRRNTVIFQDLEALEIVTRIFSDYPQAQWDTRVTQLRPSRALCTQHRETDFEFVCRLLSEEGLSFYFEHSDNATDSARLVIIDHDYQWPDGGALIFSREDTPQADDGIRCLGEQRQITNGAVTTCAWNAEQLLGVSGTANNPIVEGPALPELEMFDANPTTIFETSGQARQAANHLLNARRMACHGYQGDSATRQLRPVVIAQVYNGEATAPFSAGIGAPTNHPGTISGVQTVGLDGQPASDWQLDDAQGQLRQQLGNQTARSSLTLGYAIACEGSQRSAYQGLGFYQSTQGWGQIRAAKGLLISTSLQTGAKATQMQMSDALDQLYGAVNTTERLSQAAQQAQAGIMAAHAAQQALGDELNPRKAAHYPAQVNGQNTTQPDTEQAAERFSAPHMVLETPDHLTAATPASSNVFAGQQLQVTSQQDLHFSAGHTIAGASGGNLHWYTAKGGAKVVAQTGEVSLQAHTDRMELLADQAATFTATTGRIDLIAKARIVLQAGSASITLQGGDISFTCPGVFSIKGSEHPLLRGAKHTLNLDAMSQSQGATELAFILKDAAGIPVPEVDQILDIRAGDLRSRAVSDATAQTRRHFAAQPEPAQVHVTYPQTKIEGDSF